jgi:hypothetical protein
MTLTIRDVAAEYNTVLKELMILDEAVASLHWDRTMYLPGAEDEYPHGVTVNAVSAEQRRRLAKHFRMTWLRLFGEDNQVAENRGQWLGVTIRLTSLTDDEDQDNDPALQLTSME